MVSLSGIPVLNYHGLMPASSPLRNKGPRFWVSGSAFAEQLRCIAGSGYKVVLAEDLPRLCPGSAIAGGAAALTFDDGRDCDYGMAYPMLARAGLPATFFVNTAKIGTAGHLTWEQLGEMKRAGMSVQSHSHDHIDLARLSPPELDYQLRRSKTDIEDHLGSVVTLLALPYGSMGTNTLAAATFAGYRALCSSGGGLARSGSGVIDRICIYSETTPRQFSAILRRSPAFFGQKACRAALLGVPKRMALDFFPQWVDGWRNRHE